MTTRSLTEVFILMRNNAIRNRHIYSEQNENSERMALVSLHDVERGPDGNHMPGSGTGDSRMPPPWTDQVEEANYTLAKLETKIGELRTLHLRHLHRPTLDDTADQEKHIERLAQDISLMFTSCHRLVQHIRYYSNEGNVKERRLTTNIVKSITAKLQELSVLFRSTQNNYMRQLKTREERSRLYFEEPAAALQADDYGAEGVERVNGEQAMDDFFMGRQSNAQQQLLMIEEENTVMADRREREVNAIVRSIADLNDIFKELGQLVSEQGTVLDRIDYNIEQTQTQVYEGFRQLQKADAYQRKNRKMCCIIILAATTVLLIILLIIFRN